MKNLLITAISALALSASSAAHAGAIGTILTYGLHEERAYFYDAAQEQQSETQMRSNLGVGFEALVGDKDEKIQGILRFLWVSDSPPKNPDTEGTIRAESPDYSELSNKQTGVLGLGVQWGLLGDPADKQLVLTSIVGSGFITTDNTEYFLIELGVGGTYNITETIQANANLAVTMRNRKHISYGPSFYTGIRYLFD